MVKGDKRNKREYERKKIQEGESVNQKKKEELDKRGGKEKPAQNQGAEGGAKPGEVEPLPPSNFKGVREDAAKLITEANQRFLAARVQEEAENKWKRTITSNWTRYEMLRDQEEEEEEQDGLTGQDWEFAMSAGARAESHIKLKGEQHWDTTGSTGLSVEFFSLDLGSLEGLIKCIPLQQQIGLNNEDLDDETLSMLNRTAENNIKSLEAGTARTEDVTNKLLSLLSSSSSPQSDGESKKNSTEEYLTTQDLTQVILPKTASELLLPLTPTLVSKPSATSPSKPSPAAAASPKDELTRSDSCGGRKVRLAGIGEPESDVSRMEDSAISRMADSDVGRMADLAGTNKHVPQEQRQRRRDKTKDEKDSVNVWAEPTAAIVGKPSQPLDQRARRKDRNSAAPAVSPGSISASPVKAEVVVSPQPITERGISLLNPSAAVIVSQNPTAAAVIGSKNPTAAVIGSHNPEEEDLKFLESLEKPTNQIQTAPSADERAASAAAETPTVVPVKILEQEEKKDLEQEEKKDLEQEEKKNLEDWLDDFLGD